MNDAEKGVLNGGTHVTFDPTNVMVSYKDRKGCGPRSNKQDSSDQEVDADTSSCGSEGAVIAAEMIGNNGQAVATVDSCEYTMYRVFQCKPMDPYLAEKRAGVTPDELDVNKDGVLTPEEMQQALNSREPPFTAKEADDYIKEKCACNKMDVASCKLTKDMLECKPQSEPQQQHEEHQQQDQQQPSASDGLHSGGKPGTCDVVRLHKKLSHLFNGKDQLTKEEFNNAMKQLKDAADAEYFRKVKGAIFDDLDSGNTGLLTATQMKEALMKQGWTEQEADRFVAEACKCAKMEVKDCSLDRAAFEEGKRCITTQDIKKQAEQDLASNFDSDGNGKITPPEMKQVLLAKGTPEDEIDAFIAKICAAAGMEDVAKCEMTKDEFNRALAALAGKSETPVHVRPSETHCAEVFGTGPGAKCFPNGDTASKQDTCAEQCQAFFDEVQKACVPGDTLEGGLRYGTYFLWGKFHQLLPKCKLPASHQMYASSACDHALETLINANSPASGEGTNECLRDIQEDACTNSCTKLIERVNEHCAKSETTFVPTLSTYKDKAYELVTYGRMSPMQLGFHETLSRDCFNKLRVPGHLGEPNCHDMKEYYAEEDNICEKINGLMDCKECKPPEDKVKASKKEVKASKKVVLDEELDNQDEQFDNVMMYRALKTQRMLEAAAEYMSAQTAWKPGAQVVFHGSHEGLMNGQRGVLEKFSHETGRWLVDFGTMSEQQQQQFIWMSSMYLTPYIARRTTAWKEGDTVSYHDSAGNIHKGVLVSFEKKSKKWKVDFGRIPEFGGKLQKIDPKLLTLDVAPQEPKCWWERCPVPIEKQGEYCTGTRSVQPVNATAGDMNEHRCSNYYGPYITKSRRNRCDTAEGSVFEFFYIDGTQYTASACYFQFTYRESDKMCVPNYEGDNVKLCKPQNADVILDEQTWQSAAAMRAEKQYHETWKDHEIPTAVVWEQFRTDGGFVFRNSNKQVVAVRFPRISRTRDKPKPSWKHLFWKGKLLVGHAQALQEKQLEADGILANMWMPTSDYMQKQGVKAMVWQPPCGSRDYGTQCAAGGASFCPRGCWGFDTGGKFIFFQVMPADESYIIPDSQILEYGADVLWNGEKDPEASDGELKGLAFGGGAFVLSTAIDARQFGIWTDVSDRKSNGEQMWKAAFQTGEAYYGAVSQWAKLHEARENLDDAGIPKTAAEFAWVYPGKPCGKDCTKDLQTNFRPDDPSVGVPMEYKFDDSGVKAVRVLRTNDKEYKPKTPLIDINIKESCVKMYLFDADGVVERVRKVDLQGKMDKEVEIVNAVKFLMDDYAERQKSYHLDNPKGYIFAWPDSNNVWKDAPCLARRVASSVAFHSLGWKVGMLSKDGPSSIGGETDMSKIWPNYWKDILNVDFVEIEKGNLAGIEAQLKPSTLRLGLLSSKGYANKKIGKITKLLLQDIATELCKQKVDIQIVTEGNSGPQQDFLKAFVHCAKSVRAVAQLEPYDSVNKVIGKKIVAGKDKQAVDSILVQVADVYLLVEGGKETKDLALQALERPDAAIVLPLQQTKGVAVQNPFRTMQARDILPQAGKVESKVWDTITKGTDKKQVAKAIVQLLKDALAQQNTLPRLRGIHQRWRRSDEKMVSEQVRRAGKGVES
eukprot:gnl/MRDRNA2_/MRDRNA2_80085_c0_seq2.p1 gnl/MRDRNA2_/MRDRNA2_80085_c0~~gnl/MRDRNA2_/MRDRNA2_80085_c0_seq2.p1  ORF type:complete len:1621 (+),score=350.53 gnl/MRDRNA2_/MRDRNA2_80085_c0_seq2:51-4913(+)